MGIGRPRSSCNRNHYDYSANCSECFKKDKLIATFKADSDKNPDPSNFKIIKRHLIGNSMVLFVNYPNCKNHEGNKIMVYLDVDFIDLINQRTLDPHFSDNKDLIAPFARFEPTDKGWDAACDFLKAISK